MRGGGETAKGNGDWSNVCGAVELREVGGECEVKEEEGGEGYVCVIPAVEMSSGGERS